jgi:hypothetical protein
MATLMRNAWASHTDYGDFKGLIPDNLAFVPSNVDGIAERKGKFLVMEWKRSNEKSSTGQRIMLQALAARSDFIVLIIRGDTDNGVNMGNYYLVQPQGGCILIGNGFESFKDYYKQWYEWADGDQQ